MAGYDGLFPALSIEALRVAQEASTYLIKSSGASGEMSFGEKTGIVAIRTGNLEVPTDARGRLIVYDTGHKEERFISARAILNDEVPAEKIEGNVFFVGTSAIGLKDLRNTPVQDAVPGVELHAQLAEQMLEQKFLARPDYADGAEFLYLAIIGLLLVVLLPRLSAGKMAVVATTFIGIGLAVPWIAYSNYQLLFDPIYPPVTFAAIYVGGTALAFMRTERERAEIRGAFGMYLSPDLVEQLARNPSLLQLGGEQREITVMFTDVRGFTTISEQFDPHGLTRFMNRFLTPMTDLILGLKGTIDKYMGGRHHGVLERAAPRGAPCRARLRRRPRHAGAPRRPERGMEGRGGGRGAQAHPGEHRRRPEHRPRLGRQFRLDAALHLFLPGRRREPRLAPRRPVQDLRRRHHHRPQDPRGGRGLCDAGDRPHHREGEDRARAGVRVAGDPAVAQTGVYRALQGCQDEFLRLYRGGAFAEALETIGKCQAAADAAGWRQTYYEMMRGRSTP